jgi:cell division protein FtsB
MAPAILRALPILVLTVAAVSVPVLILNPEGWPRMRALEQELTRVERENEGLRSAIGQLRRDVKELRDNPAAIERIARDQLGLVRKNEVVYQFR